MLMPTIHPLVVDSERLGLALGSDGYNTSATHWVHGAWWPSRSISISKPTDAPATRQNCHHELAAPLAGLAIHGHAIIYPHNFKPEI
jgi:hypothetical protein